MSVITIAACAGAVLAAFLFLRSGDDRVALPPGAAPADSADSAERIHELAASGRKIEAIKLYRAAHGVGLAEAKEAVEALQLQ
jgi:ribosomal protein L7/L12